MGAKGELAEAREYLPDALQSRIIGFGYKPASAFLANPDNWRIHGKDQLKPLKASLEQIGWLQAVLESSFTGCLLDGHARVLQAMSYGDDTQVPFLLVRVESIDEERLILAIFDQIAKKAGTDKDKYRELMKSLDGLFPDFQDFLEQLAREEKVDKARAALNESEPAPDLAEELRETWQTEPGQLWLIPSRTLKGQSHRLYCGDSTSEDALGVLMAGSKAKLLIADPPYNVAVDYGEAVDDSKSEADYIAFSRAWFLLWRQVSERQIVTPGLANLGRWYEFIKAPYHVAPCHVGSWEKTNAGTRGYVSRFFCWEPVLFYGSKWPKIRANDVFDFPVNAQSQAQTANHPCPKPLRLWADILDSYTLSGELVIDAFSGSGTTLAAAEQLGRVAYTMELEPKFVAVALQRLANMGLKPALSECGQSGAHEQ